MFDPVPSAPNRSSDGSVPLTPLAGLCWPSASFPATPLSLYLRPTKLLFPTPRHALLVLFLLPGHLLSPSPIKILPVFQHHVFMPHPQRKEVTFFWSCQQKRLHITLTGLLLEMYLIWFAFYLCQYLSHSPHSMVSSLRARTVSLIFDPCEALDTVLCA